MTDLERYFGGILTGEIVACEKMKRVSERLMEQFASPGEFTLTKKQRGGTSILFSAFVSSRPVNSESR